MPLTIHRCSRPQELASDAARMWLDLLRIHPQGKTFTVALSGGRIPNLLYAALLASDERRLLDQVDFFWGDERCVPPNHEESNYKLAAENLLVRLPSSKERVHRLRVEQGEEIALAEGESELRRSADESPSGQPIFDLILLGMGEDGHVASLFPNEDELLAGSPAVYRAVTGPKPPPRRITLGYATISSARRVWVLASGSGKENALRKSIAGDGNTPLARVLRSRENTDIFTDIALA